MNSEEIKKVTPPWKWAELNPKLSKRDPHSFPERQGVEEAMDDAWRSFWSELTREDKTAYLQYWNASEDWKAAIESLDQLEKEVEKELERGNV